VKNLSPHPDKIMWQRAPLKAPQGYFEARMNQLTVGDTAPDFALPNQDGVVYKLSDIYRAQNVLLVFNIGFI
jgi:hypothetical protein